MTQNKLRGLRDAEYIYGLPEHVEKIKFKFMKKNAHREMLTQINIGPQKEKKTLRRKRKNNFEILYSHLK